MRARRRLACRGISTAEVLVGTALSLAVIGALYGFFNAQQRAYGTVATYASSQAVTRSLLDLFAREARMASYDPTGGALATSPGPTCPGVKQGVTVATATAFRFRQDLTGDGLLTAANEDVLYELVGGEIRRSDGGAAPVTLAASVGDEGLRFRYFDNHNPANELVPAGEPASLTSAQRDCVARVELIVRAMLQNPDPHGRSLTSTARSTVAIRSRSLTNF